MPSKTANKALAIFFLVFAAGLSAFIVTQGVALYKGTAHEADITTKPSVDCVRYAYEVERFSYGDGELSLTVKNLDYGGDIHNLSVAGQTLLITLLKGSSQEIRIAADINESFYVFPGGCSIFKTTCQIKSGECSS